MIKIFKKLYINPLCFPIVILFYLTGSISLLFISYCIIIIHELSHLAAALAIGLCPERIEIHPFGVCLKLKNKIVRSMSDEIILYLSGPLSNILMALSVKTIFYFIPYAEFIYLSNIMLFLANMLPIVPLDGGILLRRILTFRYGKKTASVCMAFTSVILCIILSGIGIYFICKNTFNYSVIVLAALAIGNLFGQSEKYDIEYTKELMFYSDKKNPDKMKVKVVLHRAGTDLRLAASSFCPSDYSIVCVMDENNNIKEWLSEQKVLSSLLK